MLARASQMPTGCACQQCRIAWRGQSVVLRACWCFICGPSPPCNQPIGQGLFKLDLLLALALADNALNLIQSAVNARRAMLSDVAANFTRSTALTCLRSSSLDTLRWSYAAGLEFRFGGSAFGSLRVSLTCLRTRWRRSERFRKMAVHKIHSCCAVD